MSRLLYRRNGVTAYRRALPTPTRRHADTPKRRAGLTLIEVLLAVLILGVALPPLVAAAGRCLAIAKKARHYETARELLARVELEHPVKRDEIDEANDSGTFDSEYEGYSWKREVELVGLEDDGLHKITTTITWSERGLGNSETIVTYLHAPPEKGVEESF
jgi:prepilin-type N-terminal cleavage/methylation domain-containing protein